MAKKEKYSRGTVVWKDRKRICGLPLSFTKYELYEDKIFIAQGLFNFEEDEVLLYRILDVRYKKTMMNRIFGVGTITLLTADETHKTLILKNIKDSRRVRDTISTMVEETRRKMMLQGRELFGVAHSGNTCHDVSHTDPTII